ncbi:MAG: hypothetical protein ABSD47_11935 [Candidatus Methylomirabilota bacterium]|jgi:hypothetical protein
MTTENQDPTTAQVTENQQPGTDQAQTPTRQRKVFYGDLEIPIPDGATREDIREVMLRTYPELSNATMMDLPGGDVRFVQAAGEKG